jgi:hypothetical protein
MRGKKGDQPSSSTMTIRLTTEQRADRPATILSLASAARVDAIRASISTCYACGVSYLDDGAGDNYCSDRCAAAIALGAVPRQFQNRFVPPATINRKDVGRLGVFRDCACCVGRFESLGLTMCPGCYRRRGAKEDCALPGIYGGRESAAGAAKCGRAPTPAQPQTRAQKTLKTKGDLRDISRGTPTKRRLEMIRSKDRARKRSSRARGAA